MKMLQSIEDLLTPMEEHRIEFWAQVEDQLLRVSNLIISEMMHNKSI
jgi:hypothetical protein